VTKVTVVGGPTALIEYAGLRWLTDPTFSEPGEYENLVKTTSPALSVDQLGQVDVVLLSHDEIAERFSPVDVAVLFVGAVQIPTRFDGAYLTLSSDRAAIATELLEPRTVVPVHFEGWTHFTQGLDQIRAAFAGYGLSERLLAAEPGETVDA
jgi:L-ascorbate metabolism protein UlaG (beta-lactamase superfamily)